MEIEPQLIGLVYGFVPNQPKRVYLGLICEDGFFAYYLGALGDAWGVHGQCQGPKK